MVFMLLLFYLTTTSARGKSFSFVEKWLVVVTVADCLHIHVCRGMKTN